MTAPVRLTIHELEALVNLFTLTWLVTRENEVERLLAHRSLVNRGLAFVDDTYHDEVLRRIDPELEPGYAFRITSAGRARIRVAMRGTDAP